ncbi:MAG: molybdenum ABC transporter ATP-binding protein [Acidobacteria bacterium RIFCSPLOWO2_02_FULL_65_29]|nr:MAG: molybdenum ABC transporter ATP-binding protein [Acidobacteria bacterium RIFCSPLOWO2_02_FULL_65_29]
MSPEGPHRALAGSIQKRLSPGFALDVQVSAPAGITIVFGESGSGKTTLLRCLAGLDRPDAGRIVVGERVLFDSPSGCNVSARDRGVGFVFQQLALFPHLSVRDNIRYGLHRLSPEVRAERTRAVAESFRIDHLLDRKPSAVSGGERQRTALARALVTDPDLLLLDEPLSALDHATQSRIMADLRAWNTAHAIPILYVTHAHREVFALGERVMVLDAGRVLAEGTTHDVMEAPAHEPLAQLAGFENFFDGAVVARRPDAGTMQCRLAQAGIPLEVPLSHATEGEAVRIAIRAGDILLANQEPRGLSARNILRGRVRSLTREGPTVRADVDAGAAFAVHLTPGACESLRLEEADEVWLIIKTHSCRLVEPSGALS